MVTKIQRNVTPVRFYYPGNAITSPLIAPYERWCKRRERSLRSMSGHWQLSCKPTRRVLGRERKQGASSSAEPIKAKGHSLYTFAPPSSASTDSRYCFVPGCHHIKTGPLNTITGNGHHTFRFSNLFRRSFMGVSTP